MSNNYLERFLVAFEGVAASLAIIASADVPASAVQVTPPPEAETPEAEAPADAKPKRRTRRTKAQMEAARAAEAEGAAAEPVKSEPVKSEPVKSEPVKAETPAFDYAILKANVIKLANGFGVEGRSAAVALLAEYGVAKADKAPPEKWPEMNAKFEEAIAELSKEEDEDEDFA